MKLTLLPVVMMAVGAAAVGPALAADAPPTTAVSAPDPRDIANALLGDLAQVQAVVAQWPAIVKLQQRVIELEADNKKLQAELSSATAPPKK